MDCSLDKIDLTAHVGGRPVALQTDHRPRAEIEAESALSARFAMVRVIEKLLDRAFMRTLHRELDARILAAATPARGLLLVTAADDTVHLAKFSALARMRHDDRGPRAITAAVLLITDGLISGCLTQPEIETASS